MLKLVAPIAAGLCLLCASTPAQPESEAIERLMERVADWQLRHMESFDYVATYRERTAEPLGWVQATFFLGLTRLAQQSRDPRYAAAIEAHGKAQRWQLGPRPYHADDDVIGQTWLWLHTRTGNAATIAPLQARFDRVLAAPAEGSLEFSEYPSDGSDPPCQTRWCWSDALFMAPPTWAGLAAATGNSRYFQHADAEYWRIVAYLYDRDEQLFYRDSRYLTRRDAGGAKIFWSRGNGWVLAGLTRMIELAPAPHRARYERLFVDMATRVARLQQANGYWPVSLLAPGDGTAKETSGTAFFVYALAWGVNRGLLDCATHRPAIERGWHALTAAVDDDGRLGWVQQVGYAPDRVAVNDTQLYGVGALLLAGSEVRQWYRGGRCGR